MKRMTNILIAFIFSLATFLGIGMAAPSDAQAYYSKMCTGYGSTYHTHNYGYTAYHYSYGYKSGGYNWTEYWSWDYYNGWVYKGWAWC